ncbi:hypothetical protein AGMMS49543_20730 [Betaproteobacteria bacterium]|nr:hypothetical protein AGMMS49543_20730 [Betaproteobacteria bacterium]
MPTTLQDQIDRLTGIKEDIRQATNAKGRSIPTSMGWDGYANEILQISGGTPSDPVTVVFNYINQDGNPIIDRRVVERHSSLALPADMSMNISAHAHNPALTCTGIIGGESFLGDIETNMVLTANYTPTESNAQYVFIDTRNVIGACSIQLNFTRTGDAVDWNIDWGDASLIDVITPTDNPPYAHTYASGNWYMIKIYTNPSANASISYGVPESVDPVHEGRFYSGDITVPYSSKATYSSQVLCMYMDKTISYFPSKDGSNGYCNVFEGLTNLLMLTLSPSMVHDAKNIPFSYCLNLEYVSAPTSQIGGNLPVLKGGILPATTVTASQPMIAMPVTIYDYTDDRVEIVPPIQPETTNSGYSTYASCKRITEVGFLNKVPATSYMISEYFADASSIRRVGPLPTCSTVIIGDYFLNMCTSLTDVQELFTKVQSSTVYIADGFLYGCHSIRSLDAPMVWPNVISSMGIRFLFECKGLKTMSAITVADNMNLSSYFMVGCTSLERFGDPATSTCISSQTGAPINVQNGFLAGCTRLKHVYRVPAGSTFNSNGFCSDCVSLEEIDLRGQPAGSIRITQNADGSGTRLAFNNCPNIKFIQVDADQLAAYQSMNYGWDEYTSRLYA